MPEFFDGRWLGNTDYIINAYSVDGSEAYDGLYCIAYVLKIGDFVRDYMSTYSDKNTRDATFELLGKTITGENQ